MNKRMAQVFKQKNNPIVVFAFIGIILVSQLMVLNMGYRIPAYFWVPLLIFVVLIVWGMLFTSIEINGDILTSKVGPFRQRIDIHGIERIKLSQYNKKATSRDRMEKVTLFYGKRSRLVVSPKDVDGFVEALKKVNKNLSIESPV